VALVSDRAIRALNRVFLHHDYPTDVLAFPAGGGAGARAASAGRYLGDVVISVDRARVQARTAGHPLGTEIALLAVHGVLHLLGYDDHLPRQASRMARRQQMLLAEAGIEVSG
jgi:probable rRNA maturation factor